MRKTVYFFQYKTISKVLSKDDIKDLANQSINGFVSYRIDGDKIASDIDTQSDVRQKAEKLKSTEKTEKSKKSSFWNTVKEAGKSMVKSTRIQAK